MVSAITRRAFEQSERDRSSALVAQFHREFDRRGDDVVRRVQAIASSDSVTRMALDLSRQSPDPGAYVDEAGSIAKSQRLDFLEFVEADGTIVSSAQWPAKFGYKEPLLAVPAELSSPTAFLKREDLPGGAALGVFAVRYANVGDKPLYVIAGVQLDREFLASLELPTGMRVMLYFNVGATYSPHLLIDASGPVQHLEKL